MRRTMQFGGACTEHREQFIRLMIAYGLFDPADMELVRMMCVAEIARQYGAAQVRLWLTERCVWCDEPEVTQRAIHKMAEAEAALREIEMKVRYAPLAPSAGLHKDFSK